MGVQAIWTLNRSRHPDNAVGQPAASPSLQFSVMEALYARGFTSAKTSWISRSA